MFILYPGKCIEAMFWVVQHVVRMILIHVWDHETANETVGHDRVYCILLYDMIQISGVKAPTGEYGNHRVFRAVYL